jgi:hypothetical protein
MADTDKKWQEWTTNVLEQLIDLNNRYESLSKEISSKFNDLSKELNDKHSVLTEKISLHDEIITGKNDPSKGVVIRLDRIEQTDSRRGWWTKTTLAACITAIIAAFFAIFKKP